MVARAGPLGTHSFLFSLVSFWSDSNGDVDNAIDKRGLRISVRMWAAIQTGSKNMRKTLVSAGMTALVIVSMFGSSSRLLAADWLWGPYWGNIEGCDCCGQTQSTGKVSPRRNCRCVAVKWQDGECVAIEWQDLSGFSTNSIGSYPNEPELGSRVERPAGACFVAEPATATESVDNVPVTTRQRISISQPVRQIDR